MTTRLLASLGLLTLLALPGCGESPTPSCGPTATGFRVCDGDVLYRCPVHSEGEEEMIRVEDCAAAGKVCVEVYVPVQTASCKDPT